MDRPMDIVEQFVCVWECRAWNLLPHFVISAQWCKKNKTTQEIPVPGLRSVAYQKREQLADISIFYHHSIVCTEEVVENMK